VSHCDATPTGRNASSGNPAEQLPSGVSGAPAAESESTEDRGLMERVRGGDEAAFAALMQRWELPVKAVIARLVGNASEAEELAQEAFVRLWQQRGKFRVGAEFRPWLLAIAVNLARNRLRWWRRRPMVTLDEWSLTEGAGIEGGREESGLERAERVAAVRAAVAALPVPLREAIVLFEYEALSQAEIALAVGATPKAVETRIHRAREKLRSALRRWL
jgi:RNA polymerase sigma-70 factor (ECF subfamily)